MLGRIPTETKRTNPKRLDTEVVVAIIPFPVLRLASFSVCGKHTFHGPLREGNFKCGCYYVSLTKEITKKYIVGKKIVKYLIKNISESSTHRETVCKIM